MDQSSVTYNLNSNMYYMAVGVRSSYIERNN